MSKDWEQELGVKSLPRSDVIRQIGESDDYYVYVIWKTYVDTPTPFYVGKGHWQRLIKHEMASDRGNNVHKTNVIKKHQRLGVELGYSIVDFFSDEYEALELEKQLIFLIGRHDLGSGPLTNKSDGGNGSLGHIAPRGGDSASARVVAADGVLYSCLKDAAAAAGVEPGAISQRIANGWDGYYYEDEGQQPAKDGNLGRYRKRVVVEGKEYESASAASRHRGMTVQMISKRIAYGWEGYYYVDQGQLTRRTTWGRRLDKVEVEVRGVVYSSVAEACRETGESTAIISKRALSPNYDDYRRLDGTVVQVSGKPRTAEPVFAGGVYFDSITAAAMQHRLTEGGVSYRCRSSNFEDWYFVDEDKQRTESVETAFSSKPVQVTIDGVSYLSQSDAASEHGISISALKKRCRSLSRPLWICEGIEKVAPKDGRPGVIPVVIEEQQYRSVSQASEQLDIPRATIKARIESADWAQYYRQ